MGGGDLNSKKSWHPNTMKNQERVWKAEQQAAAEKKRIQELQRERAEERDLAKLNDLARANSSLSANNDRLHWMYDKPDKKAQQEDYLLGKAIDKNYEEPDQTERDVIPAVARRVVGSSMLATTGDIQVDMARKIREDPLLLVKERERAARAALLNNPLQRRRLTELLRKEQAERESNKTKKIKTKDNNLDSMLAAKLSALSGEKNINLATLLASDDSSSSSDDSDSNKKRSKKKKKKKNKHEKAKKVKKDKIKKKKFSRQKGRDSSDSSHNSSDVEKHLKRRSSSLKNPDTKSKKHRDYKKNHIDETDKKHRRDKEKSDEISKQIKASGSSDSRKRRYDSEKDESGKEEKRSRRDVAFDKRRNDGAISGERKLVGNKREEMSGQERAERLAAMAAEGARHERERGRRVAEQRATERNEERSAGGARRSAAPIQALPESLEARIHSNRHYIQRDRRHMDQHFARRM